MKELEHIDCMGEEKREQIVNDYDIKLIIYAKLLNGQTKKSDAHKIIKDKYYQFECILKTDRSVIKTITCGSGAGEHLIKLANIDKPQLFNPLRNELPGGGGEGGNGTNNTSKKKWDPLAKELYNAIRWLICCWDIVPYGKLLNIKEGLENFYYRTPFASRVIDINKIIKNDKKGRTITQMIGELKNENNIRDFSFERINQILKENNIESYF